MAIGLPGWSEEEKCLALTTLSVISAVENVPMTTTTKMVMSVGALLLLLLLLLLLVVALVWLVL